MKSHATMLIGALVSMLLLAPAAQAAPIPIKITSSVADQGSVGRSVATFKKFIEEKTNGKYRIDYYGQFKLGSMENCYQGMRLGTIHFLIEGPSNISNFIPALQLFDISYIFPSEQAADKVLHGPIGDKFLKLATNKDVTSLAFLRYHYRMLFTVKKINDLRTDLKGIKVRTSNSKMQMAMLKAWGMNPTPVPGSETYTGLQQGVVEGFDSVPPYAADSRWYEPCSTGNLTNACYTPQILFTSTRWWNKLSPEDKAVFEEGIKLLVAEQEKNAEADTPRALDQLSSNGITLRTPTAEEYAWLKAQVADVYKEFPAVDPELLKEIRAAGEAAELELHK